MKNSSQSSLKLLIPVKPGKRSERMLENLLLKLEGDYTYILCCSYDPDHEADYRRAVLFKSDEGKLVNYLDGLTQRISKSLKSDKFRFEYRTGIGSEKQLLLKHCEEADMILLPQRKGRFLSKFFAERALADLRKNTGKSVVPVFVEKGDVSIPALG